jgi:hypothetical protein
MLAGCVSDGYQEEAVYYDNGVGYSQAEWQYEVRQRELESQTFYYHSSWPYQTRPYHSGPYYRYPDTSYRHDDRGRDRDRDQQRESYQRESSDRGYRYPEDRQIDRKERPVERTDQVDRPRDTVRDIERNRERERAREDARPQPKPAPRPEARPEPRPESRTEPRGDRNVRDVEQIRSRQPDRPSQTGAEQSGDRVRRR